MKKRFRPRASTFALVLAISRIAEAQCGPIWDGPLAPGPLCYHNGVADEIRNEVVVVGGKSSLSQLGGDPTTWAWSAGLGWRIAGRVNVGGTGNPGYNFGIAWNAARGRVYITGGTSFASTINWNGTAWAQEDLSLGPGSRGQMLIYDTLRDKLVAQTSVGAYELQSSAWVNQQAIIPGVQYDMAMAYDSVRGITVLFGGLSGSTLFGNTWERSNGQWVQVASTGPSPRDDARMVFDRARNECILFGGPSTSPRNETWAWNGTAWRLAATTGPSPRFGVTLVYDPVTQRVILHGGANATRVFSDMWAWDGVSWTQIPGGSPPPGTYPMAYDAARHQVVLYASGVGENWIFENGGWRWVSSGTVRPPSGGVMTYDAARQRIMLYSPSLFSYDVWLWDGSAWSSIAGSSSNSPAQVTDMTFDPSSGQVFLVGSGTWTWNGTSWTRLASTASTAIGTLAFDESLQSIVCYGTVSTSSSPSLSRLWQWNGAAWDDVAALADDTLNGRVRLWYDTRRSKLMMLSSTGRLLYEREGRDWNPLLKSIYQSFHFNVAAAWNSDDQQAVLFGGTSTTGAPPYSETWRSSATISPTRLGHGPLFVRACPTGTAQFSVIPVGNTGPLSFTWRRGSTVLTDGTTSTGLVVSGASTSLLALSNTQAADESFTYGVTVSDSCAQSASLTYSFRRCRIDFNCDSSISVQDIFDFLSAWFTANPAADFNGASGISVQDIFDFLAAWFAGC